MFPAELKYMESHEWAKCEGDVITVGVSDYAQQEIQDVVYVEFPEIGQTLEQKKEFGVIESVKQLLISTLLLAVRLSKSTENSKIAQNVSMKTLTGLGG